MGITNFCKLLNLVTSPTSEPEYFDSILVDVQGYLYVAIEYALQTDDDKFRREVCHLTWTLLSKHLDELLSHADDCSSITLVLSFDGEGVPMKWPTQRKRRSNHKTLKRKDVYRYSLFGVNAISSQVERYVIERLKHYRFPAAHTLEVILCGCNVPGEGEHKIFQVAETVDGCRHPIVASVDQDVFVLAFMRIDRYDTIQIYRYDRYYHVTKLLHDTLSYPASRLVTATFLFGNDFVPPLVSITPINAPSIHACLGDMDDDETDEAFTTAAFLEKHHSLRYDAVAHVDPERIIDFWTTTLWCRDYYTLRHFEQKYLKNPIFDRFDRNQLLTGLSSAEFSSRLLREAKHRYESLVTSPPVKAAARVVFTDEAVLRKLEPYWITPANTDCVLLRVTKRNSPRRVSRCTAIGIETSASGRENETD